MKLLRATFALLLLSLSSLAAALTIEPWAPALVQTTREQCFYPEPLAVFVRDESGLGRAAVPVTYSVPSPANAYIPNGGLGPWTVLTDSAGIARPPSPGFVGEVPGSFVITASSAAATGTAVFQLAVSGPPPARIEMHFGSDQTAMVNTAYAQRVSVRAYGADNQPVPNAAVAFAASGGGEPGGYFQDGTNIGFGQASSSGVAVAPVFTANEIAGPGIFHSIALGGASNVVDFRFFNSAAGVASIEPLPGSTPQSARKFAFFPQPIGALVRDAAGNPLRDAAVTFSILWRTTGGFGFFMTQPATLMDAVVMTGADGRAHAPAGVMAMAVGTVDLTASVPGAAPARYALASLAGPPTRFEVVSGDNQRALINSTYPLPWSIRAVGDDGLPVPYAAVQMVADPRPFVPSGSFAGLTNFYVMADAGGVATSPPFTANGIEGAYFGSVHGFADFNQVSPYAAINYENLSREVFVRFLDIPGNAPVGGTTWAPFFGLVTDKLGRPVANVAYRYTADSTCGRFLGQAEYFGVTDSQGRALSPLFEAIAPSLGCNVGFAAEGGSFGIGVAVHNFLPANLVLASSPAMLSLHSSGNLTFVVSISADGRPVYYPATLAVTTGNSGATAFLDMAEQDVGGSIIRGHIVANNRPGTYDILARAGPVQLAIPVVQKKGQGN